MPVYIITAIAGFKRIIIEAPNKRAATVDASKCYENAWNLADVDWDAFEIINVFPLGENYDPAQIEPKDPV